jgi:hypothetical protein
MQGVSALERTIDIYCAAWSDPDPQRRCELLESVWAPGATYTDPTVHAAGRDELLAHIDAVLSRRAGAKVARTGPVDAHHQVARFSWHAVSADGKVLREGVDVVDVDEAGRLTRVVGFFEPAASR